MKRLLLPWSARQRHTFICGRTGSGKSELLVRIGQDDLEAGRGLVLIDPHGDLADRVLGLVPPERRDDVVLIEPSHERTAAIPVLEPGVPPEVQVGVLDDVYGELFHEGRGFYTSRWRRPAKLALQALEALPDVEPTVVGLNQLGDDESARRGVGVALAASLVARRMRAHDRVTWDRGTQQGTTLSESAGRFAFDHAPRWDLKDALASQAVIIVKLDLGRLGTTDSGRFGRVLLTRVFSTLAALGRLSEDERPSLSIIIDEAHLFGSGAVIGSMLAQMRKFGAALTLCSQSPSRLGPVLGDVLTNCATVLALQLPKAEADRFEDRGSRETIRRIPRLPRYHAIAMLDDDEGERAGEERPLIVHPLRPIAADATVAAAVAESARHRHGRLPEAAARNDLRRFAELWDRIEELHVQRKNSMLFSAPSKAVVPEMDELAAAALADRPLPEVSESPARVEEPATERRVAASRSPLVVARDAASAARTLAGEQARGSGRMVRE